MLGQDPRSKVRPIDWRTFNMNMRIRIADEDDIPAITEIYNQAITLRTATADLTPVSLKSRRAWLADHAPSEYPVFVAEDKGSVTGWCSLSPYRAGRMALRHTAEISYYIHEDFRGLGIGSHLIAHTIEKCPKLGIRVLFAILLDVNVTSVRILEKLGFQKWGHMPNVAAFDGKECGHFYYGCRVA